MQFYIAQTTQPVQPSIRNELPPFSFLLPFLTALLGLVIGVFIETCSKQLKKKRDNAKKVSEKLEEADNMKMGNKILEAVNTVKGDLMTEIGSVRSDLTKVIHNQGSELKKSIADQGQRVSNLENTVAANTIELAVLNRTVEERIPRRPLTLAD
jgi:hypothetical protein